MSNELTWPQVKKLSVLQGWAGGKRTEKETDKLRKIFIPHSQKLREKHPKLKNKEHQSRHAV